MAGLAEEIDSTQDVSNRKGGKYLTLSIGDEEYGISILKIKEIIGMLPITTVPQTPEFVKGVINLRGKVIPVIDLRLRFSMKAIPYTERTCIIVVEVEGKENTIQTGIVVDSVSEVLNIKDDEIADTPTFGMNMNTEYILGIAKMEDSVEILLDINKVMNVGEIEALKDSTDR
ncbi:MAG: purine-binding chemotaxis protein CheW [Deltaproteobacteria bacterium]|nr:purine-binding chemotaxis protein CheW [Deltaproteobacteria bacterium]